MSIEVFDGTECPEAAPTICLAGHDGWQEGYANSIAETWGVHCGYVLPQDMTTLSEAAQQEMISSCIPIIGFDRHTYDGLARLQYVQEQREWTRLDILYRKMAARFDTAKSLDQVPDSAFVKFGVLRVKHLLLIGRKEWPTETESLVDLLLVVEYRQ